MASSLIGSEAKRLSSGHFSCDQIIILLLTLLLPATEPSWIEAGLNIKLNYARIAETLKNVNGKNDTLTQVPIQNSLNV